MEDVQKNSQNPQLNNQVLPVGSTHKEQAPIPEIGNVSDFLSHSERSPELDEDLKRSGVEKTGEKFELTKEHNDLGIEHAKESIKPHLEPKGTVKILTNEEAMQIEKKDKHMEDSIKWLARLRLKIQKVWQNIRGNKN